MVNVSIKFTLFPLICVVGDEADMHMLKMCKFVDTAFVEQRVKHPERRNTVTSNQIRYQELQENKRHNLESEGVSKIQAVASSEQAAAATSRARSDALNAQTNIRNAQTKEREQRVTEQKARSEIYKNYASGTSELVGGALKVASMIPVY